MGPMKQLCDSLNHLYACVTYLAFKILFSAQDGKRKLQVRKFRVSNRRDFEEK